MQFREDFLNEFRKTIKDILVEGDLERLKLSKEFLGFDNKAFGEFLVPLFKEDEQDLVLHHNLAYSDTPQNLVAVSLEEHDALSNGELSSENFLESLEDRGVEEISEESTTSEPNYKWCPRIFSQSSKGNLCGIVLLTNRGFEIEDVETGEVIYDNNFEVYNRFNLKHGLVISFSVSGSHIYNITYEDTIDPKDGLTYVEDCPLDCDSEGYYDSADSMGVSLRNYGSRCGVYNISDFVAKKYNLSDAHSVDLVIKEGEIPKIAWVHHNEFVSAKRGSKSSSKSRKEKIASKFKQKSLSKYDFTLEGKRIMVVGLPKSQVDRFSDLVLVEKGVSFVDFVESSSYKDTELIPDRVNNADIVLIVKRYVNHSTMYNLKSQLDNTDTSLVCSSTYGLDSLERALYRATKGCPSEEGTLQIDYPVLTN